MTAASGKPTPDANFGSTTKAFSISPVSVRPATGTERRDFRIVTRTARREGSGDQSARAEVDKSRNVHLRHASVREMYFLRMDKSG